ncbi:trypsin-like serine protease [Thalassotalea euphylliae]|uniref:Trypsin n=1 Tax=Thalassotalea euphylliae TaxID=1655234 RepID=A0A3E0UEJ3_9GAMM|nr:trypsin-like serine protease [Thalassotalea euphylliae]REL35441.1 trypsin [Thalassotalea euphylliae]
MKRFGIAAISAALMVAYPVVAKNTNPLVKPRIVGGEQAVNGDWPWMSALVFTGEELTTSLEVSGTSYDTGPFTNSPAGQASGELVDCGIGDQACSDAQDKVCLIERGEINFSVKAENCEAGGGVGVVIYNNVDGAINGTLGDDFAGGIPVVAINQEDGQALKANNLGDMATVSVSSEASLIQDSSCGATFLGGKWVLTASHCVDSASSQFVKVNVGEHDLSDGAENAIDIQTIYMHPEFDAPSLNNDIALLELVETVDAPSVTLASKVTTDNAAAEASDVTVIGWGGRLGYEPGDGPTGDFPDILHQVDLQLLNNQECRTILANSLFGEGGDPDRAGVTDVMICAAVAGGGKGSCQGDSGGPLVLNTNEGWQQLGIVSWGFGCAADGFPGVYARVAEFDDWLTAITEGIAINQTQDFHIVGTEQTFSTQVEVVNNASQTANLTYSIEGDDSFSVSDGECLSLTAGERCQLTVNYTASAVGEQTARLTINSDNSEITTSETFLAGRAIAASSDIENTVGGDENITWYNGGEQAWLANSVDGGIESGAITHDQDSIVMAVVSGEGELNFEWSVSSEENADDPAEPYDALYIYINGELVEFISGEVAFEQKSYDLTGEENRITWVYNKDGSASEGDDKGYIRNISFTPTAAPAPAPAPTPTPSTTPAAPSSSSGGGSMAWLLPLLSLVWLRRKH